MKLTILKHYVKRVLNFIKNPFRTSKILTFEDYDIKFPNIFMNYKLNGVRHTIELKYRDYQQEYFDKLTKDQWDVLIGNVGIMASPAFLNLDKINKIYCAFINLSPSACNFFEEYISGEFAEYRLLNEIDPKLHISISGNKDMPVKKLPIQTGERKIFEWWGQGQRSNV